MAASPGPAQAMFKAANAASATTTATTTTSGSLFVAVVTCFTNKIGTTPLSDSKGNTWVQAVASVGTTNGFTAIYYVENGTGGASHTFTFTPTGSDFISITVMEITGAALTSSLGSSTSIVTATATHTTGTITSNASVPEIFIGAGSASGGTVPTLPLTDPVVWFPVTLKDGGTFEGCAVAFRLVKPSVTDSFSYVSNARNEGSAIVGFKAAAAATGGAGGSFTFFGA